MQTFPIYVEFRGRSRLTHFKTGERGGSVVERRTPERNLPPPYFVLKQDTSLPESTGSTQEAVAPSRHD